LSYGHTVLTLSSWSETLYLENTAFMIVHFISMSIYPGLKLVVERSATLRPSKCFFLVSLPFSYS